MERQHEEMERGKYKEMQSWGANTAIYTHTHRNRNKNKNGRKEGAEREQNKHTG